MRTLNEKLTNLINLLQMYYHVRSPRELQKAIKEDILVSLVLSSGSETLSGIFRGIYFKLLLNYSFPAFFGSRFKIINPSWVKLGRMLWIKNDVTLFAGGPLIIGNNCVISERVSIWSGPEGINVGNNVSFGIGTYIAGLKGKIEIADEVRIADSVRMYSWNHVYKEVGKTIAQQGRTHKGIKIGENCWIGSGATILDGVVLGESCVIAAGVVVTKSFERYSVIAGVPAKVIKKFN